MRPIKFRGMDIEGRWFYGNLAIVPKDNANHKAGHCISNSAGMPFAYRVRPETVGQLTDIADRNGKESYDGDKVKWKRIEREYQDHYGDNIPNGHYHEFLGFEIKTLEGVVTFKDGAYWALNEDEDGPEQQLSWLSDGIPEWDYDEIIKSFEEDNFYLECGYESMEELLKDVKGFEVIGNIFEPPHLLKVGES